MLIQASTAGPVRPTGLLVFILVALTAGCASPPVRSPLARGYPTVVAAPKTPAHYLICQGLPCQAPSPTPKTPVVAAAAAPSAPAIGAAVAAEIRRDLAAAVPDTPPPVVAPPAPTRWQFTISMPLNAAHVGPAARAGLRDFLATLPTGRTLTYRVTGRTDNTGSLATNAPLALARALAAKAALLTLRPTAVVELEATAMCCYIAPNATRPGRIENRRAEIIATATP